MPTAVSGPPTGAGPGQPAGRRRMPGLAGRRARPVAPDPHDPAATSHPSGPTPPLARPGLTVRACAQATWPGGAPRSNMIRSCFTFALPRSTELNRMPTAWRRL